jgi:hypothetical protein
MTRSWPSQAGAQSGPPPERLPPERLPLHAGPLSRVEHVRSAGAGPAFPVRARLHGLSLRPLRGRITVCARRRASVRAAARHRVGETLWSHQGLTFGGLIVHTELTVRRALGVFDAIVAHARDDGIARMVYKASPHVYQRSLPMRTSTSCSADTHGSSGAISRQRSVWTTACRTERVAGLR